MIPSVNEVMKPFLEFISDGKPYLPGDIEEYLAVNVFKLSEQDRSTLSPVGGKTLFHTKVSFAKTYLLKAGLIGLKDNKVFITQKGRQVLKKNPPKVDIKFLLRYENFANTFMGGKYKDHILKNSSEEVHEEDPYEVISQKFEELNALLKEELLQRIVNSPPSFFEKLVLDLIVAMGYGGSFEEASRLLGKSGDEGVDGVIKQDVLGLDNVYLQAKRWTNGNVGREVVQSFVGALHGKGAKKGIFITTSGFTKHAIDYVKGLKDMTVILIDKNKLLNYMIKYEIGVKVASVIKIKKIDEEYFDSF